MLTSLIFSGRLVAALLHMTGGENIIFVGRREKMRMTIAELFCGKEGLNYDAGSISAKVTRAYRISRMYEAVSAAVDEFFRIIKKLTGTGDKRAALSSLRHRTAVAKQYICELIDELFEYFDMICTTVLSVITYEPCPAACFTAAASPGADADATYYGLQQALPGRHVPYRHQSRGSEEPASENDKNYEN